MIIASVPFPDRAGSGTCQLNDLATNSHSDQLLSQLPCEQMISLSKGDPFADHRLEGEDVTGSAKKTAMRRTGQVFSSWILTSGQPHRVTSRREEKEKKEKIAIQTIEEEEQEQGKEQKKRGGRRTKEITQAE